MQTRQLNLENARRPEGLFICGHTGSGKSSLITHIVLTDIWAGRGVCVIDPTGDLLKPIIQRLPHSRIKDVIYFSTSSPNPRSIEFLSYDRNNPREKTFIIDDIVGIFDLEDAKVARPMLHKMLNTILEANESGARFGILDLDLFTKPFRSFKDHPILRYCSEKRKEKWNPYPKPKDFETILHRLIVFQEIGAFEKVLTVTDNPINIPDIIESGKIFLVDLGDSPSDLFLGSLIVSKIRQAIWRRGYKTFSEAERTPYYTYIDECGTIMKFAEHDFATMFVRARKYKLCLTLATQPSADLPKGMWDKLSAIQHTVHFSDQYVALYMRGSKYWARIRTPKYLSVDHASYAQMLKLITVHSASCHAAPVSVDTKNGIDFDTVPPRKPDTP